MNPRDNSTKPKALVDEDITPQEHLYDRASEMLDLSIGVPTDESAVIENLRGIETIVTTSRIPLTERVVHEADSLRLIAKLGTGLDNIDLEAAEDQGISVIHTPGLNAFAVAEYALTLILNVKRQVVNYQSVLQNGGWRDEIELSSNLIGSTVGVVGFGTIGRYLATLLRGFDIELVAYDPYVSEAEMRVFNAEQVGLDSLLQRSDVVSINAKLTNETRNLIGDEEFEAMSRDAIIVNTSRGPIVNQDALVRAVSTGEIAGAGLDVFEEEPLPASSELHEYPEIVTTPHAAGSTVESRVLTIDRLIDCVEEFLAGTGPDDQYVAVRGNEETSS